MVKRKVTKKIKRVTSKKSKKISSNVVGIFQTVLWRGGANYESYKCPLKTTSRIRKLIGRKEMDLAYGEILDNCSFIDSSHVEDVDDELAEVQFVKYKRKKR